MTFLISCSTQTKIVEIPKVCVEEQPPEIPTLILEPLCDEGICYNKENALKLWMYLKDVQLWMDETYTRCKGLEE